MDDIFKQLQESGFEPEIQEDDSDFKPVKGKYVCRIDSAGRMTGTSKKDGKPYDFRTIKIQVAEIIDGDKATNRFLQLNYTADIDGMKRLLNDLFTAGIDVKVESEIELDELLLTLKDKTMNVRAWVWKDRKNRDTGEPMPNLQMVKVVKEFKGKKKPDNIKSDVPF